MAKHHDQRHDLVLPYNSEANAVDDCALVLNGSGTNSVVGSMDSGVTRGFNQGRN